MKSNGTVGYVPLDAEQRRSLAVCFALALECSLPTHSALQENRFQNDGSIRMFSAVDTHTHMSRRIIFLALKIRFMITILFRREFLCDRYKT